MKNIEVSKIIDPIPASDGAGVKLKRSIGVEPNYFDPFLMLDEFGSENSEDYIAGFPPHPHRGIETVTYMLAGDFEHEDSTGGKGRMTAGDVQWMRTGSGIIHSEMPAMKEGKLHGFQLWINMPAKLKMCKPEYIYIDADKMSVHKDKDFNYKLPETHNSFIYLINGEIKIGNENHEEVTDSTLILLTQGNKLKVKAISDAKFLVISGKPINEQIARGGPFVMNTKAEILQAVQDYHNGTFVK